MEIAIVGAGIGGLTTGILLAKKGIKVKIFEQANEFRNVGTGIILAHNAMQVYKLCGLYEQILSVGHPVNSLNITSKSLKPLSMIETKSFDETFSVQNVAIHRAELHKLLIETFKERSEIRLSKTLIDIDRGQNCKLHFSDGSVEDFDAIVAADGINSFVRNSFFPTSHLRHTNQRCLRGIANSVLPVDFKGELFEVWGSGDRFGFVQISSNKVYWYALHNINKKYENKKINETFKDYPPLVAELIHKTEPDQIFETDINDLKPISKWVDSNVCLLGDAAHATTPNLGQGACQAIEDAYVLSSCLEKLPIEDAFLMYEEIRRNKAKRIVDLSWKFGKVSQYQNPLVAGIRNKLIRMIPNTMNMRQFSNIYTLNRVP